MEIAIRVGSKIFTVTPCSAQILSMLAFAYNFASSLVT